MANNARIDTRFIYLADKIVIREKKEGDIYNYYLDDDFVFGVARAFTPEDLQNLYKNGYFDLWLYL